MNRLLPAPGGIGPRGARGADSESAQAPSPLTALGDAAARRNNQVPAGGTWPGLLRAVAGPITG